MMPGPASACASPSRPGSSPASPWPRTTASHFSRRPCSRSPCPNRPAPNARRPTRSTRRPTTSSGRRSCCCCVRSSPTESGVPSMSSFLARLGRVSFRHRGLVSLIWLVVLGAVIAFLVGAGGSFDDRFSIPGSESQEALDRLRELSPAAGGAGAEIVFVAPEGHTIVEPSYAAAIGAVVQAASQGPQVANVTDPFASQSISPDGRAALANVSFDVTREQLADGTVQAVQDATATAEDAGLQVAVGGNAFSSTGVQISALEFIGVAVAVVVLVITFGSLLAAGMNLLTALIGVAVGLGGLLLTSNFVTLSSSAPTLALMIGLAVGIDYTLFILSRHRSQLAAGKDAQESAARAT